MSKKETVEVEDEAVETPEPIEDADTDLEAAPEGEVDTEDESKAGNPEAAKYRTKLRETETERDTLAEQITAMRTVEVERIAAGTEHVNADAFWAAGATLESLLDADGAVNADAIRVAARAARDKFGLKTLLDGNHVPSEGNYSRPPEPKDDWADAFKTK